MRWRIRYSIKLNNIFKVVSSQRVSLNAGQEGSPPHGLLPFRRQSCSTTAAGRVPFATVYTKRCWQWISVGDVFECGCPGAHKFSCPTCSNSSSTPRRCDQFQFLPYTSAPAVGGSGRMYYLLQGKLLFIFPFRWPVSGHSVFRPCLLRLGVRIDYLTFVATQDAHKLCMCNRLLFYNKCTAFTVECFTYKYAYKSILNKRWITLPVVYCRPFASKAFFWATLRDSEFAVLLFLIIEKQLEAVKGELKILQNRSKNRYWGKTTTIYHR